MLGYELSHGRGTLRHLYLYLPSEDVLVFAKDSSGDWRCVSHPGVESRIRELGDNKFELYRPDGYREVYDEITGDLNQVFYPDGRSINITRVGTDQGLKETTIQQSYPPATAVVLSDLAGNIQEVYSQAKKSYRYKFRYKSHPRNIGSPQLVSITRPDGAIVAIDQTALGYHVANTSYLLNSIKLDGKELLSIGYDENARATSVETLSGNNFSVDYSGAGSASLLSAAGVSINAATTKKRVSKTEFLGEVNAPLLASVACDDCGFTDTYGYSENGVISSLIRNGDSPFTANFTLQGLLSDLHYGESESRTFSWNPDLRQLMSVSGTDVLATTIGYTDSRVTEMTSVAGASSRSVNVDRVNGDAKKLSGVNKDILSVNYTSKGFISAAKNRLGQAYKFQAHNHLGQPTKVIDPNNIETELRYDLLGRLLGISRGDGVELAVDYNVLGLPISASSNGKTMAFNYDEHQRLTSMSASCKPSLEYSYDANGHLSSVKREHGGKTQVSHYEFDADGTPTKQTSTYDDKTTTVSFNKKGQVVEVQDDENITSYAYNGNGYLTGVNLNGNATSSYTIGVMGRLDSASSLGGRNTSLIYTDFGQLKKQQNTNFGYRTYAYSALGNLTRRTTPVYETRYTYDLTDRISKVAHNQREGILPSVDINYEYDDASEDESGKNYGVGRLTAVDNGSSHYSYRYAANGALKAQTIRFPDASAETSRVSYETDIGGLLTGLTYPNGNLLAYERDSCSGEVTGLLWNGNRLARLSSSSQLNAYTLAQLNSGIEISRDFDARNRLNSVKLERAGGILWHQDYEYDNRQNLKTITTQTPVIDVGSHQQFTYDLNNRLESASGNYGALAYTYNDHSHRTTETNNTIKTRYRYYANKDQIKSLVDATGTSIKDYVYDKDGQRIQAGPWQYSYNAAGRLAEVSKDGIWVASYQYDAYGKRISKQTTTGTIYFHHDASGRLLQESDESSTVIRQYIYTDMGELFALVDAAGEVNFVHSDYLGTPLFLTSSTGEVVWSAERKPFGETEITKNVIEFPIRLPGQYYDAETGLHYNQQRYYDAETGQYLSTDPLSIAGGHQLYNYAQQNPTSYIDPEGKFAFAAAIPYIITGISAGATGYEIYDTVDGLASGRVTKEDLAAGYLLDKGVAIGLKAFPGIGAAAGIAYGYLNKSPVGEVAGNSIPINAADALQNVVNRSVADLAANPSLARDLMSPGSYMHLVKGTNLAGASYGKAVERLAARYVQEDSTLSNILQYQSRPFVSTPDFFGFEGQNLRLLDITTKKSIPKHLERSYGPATTYVTHPGLPQYLVFPL